MQATGYLVLITLFTISCLAAVASGLLVTNPSQIGPVGVTVWFLALLVGLSGLLSLVLYWLKSRWRIGYSPAPRVSNSWRQGLLMGSGLTVLLALSSLKQLSLRDVILIAMFLALLEFYFRTKI